MRFALLFIFAISGALTFVSPLWATSSSDYQRICSRTTITSLQAGCTLKAQQLQLAGKYIEVNGTVNGVFNGSDDAGTILLDAGEAGALTVNYRLADGTIELNCDVMVLACVPAQGAGALEALAITLIGDSLDDEDVSRFTLVTDGSTFVSLPQENSTNYFYTSVPLLQPTRKMSSDYGINYSTSLSSQAAVVQIYAERIRGINAAVSSENALAIAYCMLQQAEKYNIDPRLLFALVTQESRFNHRAVSSAGARGLGQLMPGTAAGLGVRNSFDIAENLSGTASYISTQLNTFGRLSLALAAYNAGPGNVRKFGGIPPFRETQNYVKVIWKHYAKLAGLDPDTGQAL